MHSATFVVELKADKNCVRTFLWYIPCTRFPIVHKKAQCLYREVSLSLQGFSVILKRLETWWAERQANHHQPVLPSSPQESHVAELAEGFFFLRAREVLLRSSLPFHSLTWWQLIIQLDDHTCNQNTAWTELRVYIHVHAIQCCSFKIQSTA